MRPIDYDYYHTDVDYLDMADAASMHDCTGLIPGDVVLDQVEGAYKEIYQYGVPLRGEEGDDVTLL